MPCLHRKRHFAKQRIIECSYSIGGYTKEYVKQLIQERHIWHPCLSNEELILLEKVLLQVWKTSIIQLQPPQKNVLKYENLLDRNGRYHGVYVLGWLGIPSVNKRIQYSRIFQRNKDLMILLVLS